MVGGKKTQFARVLPPTQTHAHTCHRELRPAPGHAATTFVIHTDRRKAHGPGRVARAALLARHRAAHVGLSVRTKPNTSIDAATATRQALQRPTCTLWVLGGNMYVLCVSANEAAPHIGPAAASRADTPHTGPVAASSADTPHTTTAGEPWHGGKHFTSLTLGHVLVRPYAQLRPPCATLCSPCQRLLR